MFPLFPTAVRTYGSEWSYDLVSNLVTLSPIRENLVLRFWVGPLGVTVVYICLYMTRASSGLGSIRSSEWFRMTGTLAEKTFFEVGGRT